MLAAVTSGMGAEPRERRFVAPRCDGRMRRAAQVQRLSFRRQSRRGLPRSCSRRRSGEWRFPSSCGERAGRSGRGAFRTGPQKKTSKTRKTTQVFGGFADGRSIVVNSGKSPTYGCPYRTPVNSMALRTQLPVLSQSLRWLGAHPAFGWVAVASAAVLSRQPQCPGRALAPLSSEWLSDIKRQKMQGREF